MDAPPPIVQDRPRSARRLALGALLALTAAYLLHPALSPVHVEGFSASIVSIARHLVTGDLGAFDPLYEVDLEFYGLSRLGTSLLVALTSAALGLGGDAAFRLVMWAGLIGLVIASVRCVRVWTGGGTLAACAALLLMPGVAESAFFYNDNVASAALSSLGLAVLLSSRSAAAAALAGAVYAYAIVARTDAVLIGAAVPLILYEQSGLSRHAIGRATAFGAAGLSVLVLVPAYFHATILDVLGVSSYAVSLWARPLDLGRHASEIAIFTGLLAVPLCALAVVRLYRTRAYLRAALLLGVPVIFNLVCWGKLWQARQLLPLTPFLAALVVLGIQELLEAGGRLQRRRAMLLGAAVLVVWLLPPRGVRVDDGPRSIATGRLWTPMLWTHWQALTSDEVGATRPLVTSARADSTVVVLTENWSVDRYAHLGLQLAGFRAVPTRNVLPACAGAAELFRDGARQVVHIRLHAPFVWTSTVLASRLLEQVGVPCLTQIGERGALSAMYFVAPDYRMRELFGARAGAQASGASSASRQGLAASLVPHIPIHTIALDTARLATLRAGFRREADTAMARGGWPAGQPTTLEELARALGGRVPFPPRP